MQNYYLIIIIVYFSAWYSNDGNHSEFFGKHLYFDISFKVNGNVVDTLMPSLSSLELSLGFMIGNLRGIFVATGVLVVIFPFRSIPGKSIYSVLLYNYGKYYIFSSWDISYIFCKKFDQMSAVNNLLSPSSFLSGTFIR